MNGIAQHCLTSFSLQDCIGAADTFVWGTIIIYVLLAMGALFTVISGFVQFRYFGRMFAVLGQAFSHKSDQPSSFQALTLSVAGRVGMGNIAGVAVAITLGGPGAIFWMWVVGLLGMATSFFECSIAQLYKRLDEQGNFRGGPAFYIVHGLKRWLGPVAFLLAGIFTVLLLVTFGIAFNGMQSFALANSVQDAFGVDKLITGIVLAVVVGFIVFGGIRRIASATEIIVPVMAVAYISVAVYVLATNASGIPAVLQLIVTDAFDFDPMDVIGGAIPAVLLYGIQRGLFSNEAGLGSAPNVAAVAYVPHPAVQGIVQSFSVFIDTILICTCTALVILLSGIDLNDPTTDGVILTQNALAEHTGEWAKGFVAVALSLFVLSSIMYNYYLGENAVDFFAGAERTVFNVFRVLTFGIIIYGSQSDLSTVFGFANLTMGLLAVVNLLALALLFPVGMRILRDFGRELKVRRKPVFDAEAFADLDIDHKAWELLPEDAQRLAERRGG